MSSELIALDFGVHKSIRYHVKRRAFFDVMHRVAMLIAVIGGSAAFFALIGEKTEVGQIAALTVAIATALDLIFAFPRTPASTTSLPSGSPILPSNSPLLHPAPSMAGDLPS